MGKNRLLPQVAKPKCAVIGRGENEKRPPAGDLFEFEYAPPGAYLRHS